MSLTKWKPFKTSLPRLWEEDFFENERPFFGLNRLFREGLPVISEDYGATDIYEENGNIVTEINLPGMKVDDIDIQVEKDLIRISAESEEETEDKDDKEGRKYYAREIIKRSFSRTFPLPQTVKEKDAKAEYKDGILKITAPKNHEKNESVKVRVNK